MFYTRDEQPSRISAWYLWNGIGVAGGGLIGYGIGHVKGALASWRYEFLIVGACCSAWAIALALILPNSPATFRGFSHEEKLVMIARMAKNQTGVEQRKINWGQVKEACECWRNGGRQSKVGLKGGGRMWRSKVADHFHSASRSPTHLWAIMSHANMQTSTTRHGSFSSSASLPTSRTAASATSPLLSSRVSVSCVPPPSPLAYTQDKLKTALLGIPQGALVVIWISAGALLNDRLPKNSRTIVCALFMLPTIAGALGFLLAPEKAYVGRLICFYLTGSYQSSFVLSLSLITSNTGGQSKKMIVSGMIWFGKFNLTRAR